jgi:hypothetical protein
MQTAKTKRNARNRPAGGELATDTVASGQAATSNFLANCASTAAIVSIVRLGEGLHVLEIGEASAPSSPICGLLLPAIQVSAAPNNGGSAVEIIGDEGYGEVWLGSDGGTIVVRAPQGGHVLVTTFSDCGQSAVPAKVDVQRLARPGSTGNGFAPNARGEEPYEIPTEIVLHVERLGDQSFSGRDWAGNRGRKLRIEAFSIRPSEALTARDIEFKALGPSGRQTPWVTDAKLCGTRGQGLPLTGFAIRLAPHLGAQFDVVYYGAFFESGVVGPKHNGELCVSSIADDPLEAINVQLIQRAAEPDVGMQGPVQILSRARPGSGRRGPAVEGSRLPASTELAAVSFQGVRSAR